MEIRAVYIAIKWSPVSRLNNIIGSHVFYGRKFCVTIKAHIASRGHRDKGCNVFTWWDIFNKFGFHSYVSFHCQEKGSKLGGWLWKRLSFEHNDLNLKYAIALHDWFQLYHLFAAQQSFIKVRSLKRTVATHFKRRYEQDAWSHMWIQWLYCLLLKRHERSI